MPGDSLFRSYAALGYTASDHAKDRLLRLFTSDDVLRIDSCCDLKPGAEPVQTGFEFGDGGADAPAASRKSSAATAGRTYGHQIGGAGGRLCLPPARSPHGE